MRRRFIGRVGPVLALSAALVAGTVLRAYQLTAQVLVDDEWHLVHKLRDGPSLASLIGDFGSNDHSIGLGLCSWLLMRLGPVNELSLRMPSLIAGLVLLIAMPFVAARDLDLGTGVMLAWLLAISPLLCFFSRLARPYAVTTLLVSIAVLSFYRWFVSGGKDRQARRSYLLAAASTPIFHLSSAPAVLAPFLIAAFPPSILRSSARPSTKATARLFVTTIAAMAVLLFIPAFESGGRVAARLAIDRPDVTTGIGALQLLSGTADPAVVLLFTILGAMGVYGLWRRSRTLTIALAIVIVVQIVAIAASGAAAIHVPVVAARYIAVVLPLLLVFPASGLAVIGRIAPGRTGLLAQVLVGMTTTALLFFRGPLRWIYEWPNDFTNHASYQADYAVGRYAERFRPYGTSRFYTDVLANRPRGSTTIVEAPWYYYWHDFAYYQRLHRQHVVIGFVGEDGEPSRIGEVSAADPGMRLRRAVHLAKPDTLRGRGIEFIVLHRDVFTELRWPTGVSDTPVAMNVWIDRYQQWCGPPIFDDRWIVVFATNTCKPSP